MGKKIRNHYFKIEQKIYQLDGKISRSLNLKNPTEVLVLKSILSDNVSIVDLDQSTNDVELRIFLKCTSVIYGLETISDENFPLFSELFFEYLENNHLSHLTWDELKNATMININPSISFTGCEILNIIENKGNTINLNFLALILAKYDNLKKIINSIIVNYMRDEIINQKKQF